MNALKEKRHGILGRVLGRFRAPLAGSRPCGRIIITDGYGNVEWSGSKIDPKKWFPGGNYVDPVDVEMGLYDVIPDPQTGTEVHVPVKRIKRNPQAHRAKTTITIEPNKGMAQTEARIDTAGKRPERAKVIDISSRRRTIMPEL